MRLGVWPRIGIVASVLWMLGASTVMTSNEMTEWQDRTTSMQELCLKLSNNLPAKDVAASYEECGRQSRESSDAMIAARWSLLEGSIGLSAVMLVLAWLVIGASYGTVRWILKGRRNIRLPD